MAKNRWSIILAYAANHSDDGNKNQDHWNKDKIIFTIIVKPNPEKPADKSWLKKASPVICDDELLWRLFLFPHSLFLYHDINHPHAIIV